MILIINDQYSSNYHFSSDVVLEIIFFKRRSISQRLKFIARISLCSRKNLYPDKNL